MERQQLSHILSLSLLQWSLVRVPAYDVLEKRFELVDVVILLSTKCELFDLFVLDRVPLLLFQLLELLLSQIIDDAVVVMAMLFPEFIEFFILSQSDLKLGITNKKTFLLHFFDRLFGTGFLFNCEITLVFVKSDIRSINSEILQKTLFNELERNLFLFISGNSENRTELKSRFTFGSSHMDFSLH